MTKSQDDIKDSKLIKRANAIMSVKKCDQQNNPTFSDCFTLQNLRKLY